jgi:hypothetical protein
LFVRPYHLLVTRVSVRRCEDASQSLGPKADDVVARRSSSGLCVLEDVQCGRSLELPVVFTLACHLTRLAPERSSFFFLSLCLLVIARLGNFVSICRRFFVIGLVLLLAVLVRYSRTTYMHASVCGRNYQNPWSAQEEEEGS